MITPQNGMDIGDMLQRICASINIPIKKPIPKPINPILSFMRSEFIKNSGRMGSPRFELGLMGFFYHLGINSPCIKTGAHCSARLYYNPFF